MTKKHYSPIAIDLGAKHTGFFSAHYEQYTHLKNVDNSFLCTLTHDKYQIMMTDRTAARHQRRGYDRRQLAKRLLKLILENVFNLDAVKHQEAISFLINRRGRVLGGDFDDQLLQNFPAEIFEYMEKVDLDATRELIPEKEPIDGYYDLIKHIDELVEKAYLSKDGKEKVKQLSKFIHKYKSLKLESSSYKRGEKPMAIQLEKAEENKDEEGIRKVNKRKKEIAERIFDIDKELKPYDSLPINPFDFTDKYEDPPLEDNENHKDKQKWYAYLLWNIYQILADTIEELNTGHVLRSAYHDHIKEDIHLIAKGTTKEPHSPIDSQLAQLAEAIQNQAAFGPNKDERLDRFINLVGHISNLQLRGLRKYFGDVNLHHKDGDKWDAAKLDCMYTRWLNSLRPKKDEQRKYIDSHKKYMNMKKENSTSSDKSLAISLWLDKSPKETIPPFEDQNNRRPPVCQSLLININAIEQWLPQWRQTIKNLILAYRREDLLSNMLSQWDGIMEEKLFGFANSKMAYKKLLAKQGSKSAEKSQSIGISTEQDAYLLRALQFLLDISNRHREYPILRNLKSDKKDKKERNNTESFLSEHLTDKECKQVIDFCKEYYERASEARAGRLFIRDKNREDLLTLCEEKTKHKKYQTITDFAALFGLTNEDLRKLIGVTDETGQEAIMALEKWLGRFAIKTKTLECAKLQRKHGNWLKTNIDIALSQRKAGEELVKVVDDVENKAEKMAKEIGSALNNNITSERFNSVFTFGQIHNIVYDSRSGNAKNCPCCSLDNQARMARTNEDLVFSARLPGYIARPFDGAIHKLLDANARAIAKAKWGQIEKSGIHEGEIVIPIIIEQNRFDFEENLDRKKGRRPSRRSLENEPEKVYMDKKERIREAGNGICPYTGESIDEVRGELDHILARATTKMTHQTVINSEANLIYVSSRGNRGKSDSELHISELNKKYLQEIFGENEETEIRPIVCERLGLPKHLSRERLDIQQLNELKKNIAVFREFTTFHRLDTETDYITGDGVQQAFRHALFLKPSDPIRQLVEETLKTGLSARVNGTQRYLAKLIADYMDGHINRFNKKSGAKLTVRYDYFEIDANDVQELREGFAYFDESIKKEKMQDKESHAIDALCVFMRMMDMPVMRSRDGGDQGNNPLKLQLPPKIEVPSKDKRFKDKVSDVYFKNFYKKGEADLISLNRKTPNDKYFVHCAIHRDNFYAQKFLPVLITSDDKDPIRVGFSSENSVPVKNKDCSLVVSAAIRFGAGNVYIKHGNHFGGDRTMVDTSRLFSNGIENTPPVEEIESFIKECQDIIKSKGKDYLAILAINKPKAQEFMIENFSTENPTNNKSLWEYLNILNKLAYRTQSAKVMDFLKDKNNNYIDVKAEKVEVLSKIKKKCEVKFDTGKILLPVYHKWESLISNIDLGIPDRESMNNSDLEDILRKFFKVDSPVRKHQRSRATFSLPLVSNEGIFLIKRKGWNDKDIYQISNGPDPREGGINYQKPVIVERNGKKELKPELSQVYRSLKTHYLQMESQTAKGTGIDTSKWYRITDMPKELTGYIKDIEYRVDDVSRPSIRFLLDLPINELDEISKDTLDGIFDSSYLEPRDGADDKLKKLKSSTVRKQEGWLVEWKGSGMNKHVKEMIIKSIDNT